MTWTTARGVRASNCSGKGPMTGSVGLHCYAACCHVSSRTCHPTPGRQRCRSWRGGDYRPARQRRHCTLGLLSFPCQEHLLGIYFFLSFFLFYFFFFNVCFNFIVFPTMWEGAAAKNNVAKPRGLAHIAWSLQQEQRL